MWYSCLKLEKQTVTVFWYANVNFSLLVLLSLVQLQKSTYFISQRSVLVWNVNWDVWIITTRLGSVSLFGHTYSKPVFCHDLLFLCWVTVKGLAVLNMEGKLVNHDYNFLTRHSLSVALKALICRQSMGLPQQHHPTWPGAGVLGNLLVAHPPKVIQSCQFAVNFMLRYCGLQGCCWILKECPPVPAWERLWTWHLGGDLGLSHVKIWYRYIARKVVCVLGTNISLVRSGMWTSVELPAFKAER